VERLIKIIEWVAASWYLAFVLTNKAGPFNLFTRAREWHEGKWHGRTFYWNPQIDHRTEKIFNNDGLMDCIICLLPYVGFGWWLVDQAGFEVVMMPFAIAGLALWAHGYTGWVHLGGK